MLDRITREFEPEDYWRLSYEQQVAFRERAIRRAHTQRADSIRFFVRRLFVVIGEGVSRAALRLSKWRAAYVASRTNRAAVAELMELDDCTLKDIGVRRSEIESVVRLRDSDKTRHPRLRQAA